MQTLSRRLYTLLAVLSLVLVSTAAGAQDRTVTVKFPRGASGTTIEDSIRGDRGINYLVGVSAGQQMSVQLDTDNPSSYFNITAPGASEALFIGSISGNSTTFEIPSSGNYAINVYLMRNAARRNETANFELTIYVEGRAAAVRPAPTQPDFADGLAGGPDFWEVTGLKGGDTLNIRASASTSAGVRGTLRNDGDVVSSLGCTMNGDTRWCQIRAQRGLSGWVAGRYLHESFGNAHEAVGLPRVAVQRPAPNPTPSQVDTSLMPRFCQGEASAEYGVRPQDLTTNIAFQSGDRYVVQGYFDGEAGTTFFNCWFDLDGEFQSIS